MDLAGTGLEGHRHFAAAAEVHRRDFVKYLNDDMRDNAAGESFGYMAGRDVWQQAPPFEYELPEIGAALESSTMVFVNTIKCARIAARCSSPTGATPTRPPSST